MLDDVVFSQDKLERTHADAKSKGQEPNLEERCRSQYDRLMYDQYTKRIESDQTDMS